MADEDHKELGDGEEDERDAEKNEDDEFPNTDEKMRD